MLDRGHAVQFVADVAAAGRYCFTTDEAVRAFGGSLVAARAALRRLKARIEIADPHRGFHVIVPPEYRQLGCLPADQFVSQLMEYLHEPYYVALLSAAELHGARSTLGRELSVADRAQLRPAGATLAPGAHHRAAEVVVN